MREQVSTFLGTQRERLRGIVDRFFFWALFRLRRIVSFFLAFAGLFFALAYPGDDVLVRGLTALVGLGALIASLYEVRDIVRDRRRIRLDGYGIELYRKIQSKLPSTIYKGWSYLENERAPLPEAVIFDNNVNARLDQMTVACRLRDSKFTVRNRSLRHYSPIIRRKIGGRTNEGKLRLCTEMDESVLRGREIEVQETRYFYSICTNEFASRRLMEKGRDDRAILDGKTLFVDKENRLRSLSDSECSNHIGVSTLVITADSMIPIGKQTGDSVGSPGRWAPTGSGSVDFRDLTRLGHRSNLKLRDLLVDAMEREAGEESNLQDGRMETHIVGYSKLLHRGGKPEFFGITFSNAHSEVVRIKGKEPLYMEDHVPHDVSSENRLDLEAHLRSLQAGYEKGAETSFILLLNLRFAADFVANSDIEWPRPDF